MMEGKSWHGGLPWYLALAYLNASPSMEYFLLLMRAKADVASFDCGVLSVSWSAQFSVFCLPVNFFFFLACLRAAIEFKCGKTWLCTRRGRV